MHGLHTHKSNLNRQLLFQHQTTQIYNPAFFVLNRGLQKRPVIQRCKLFVSWKLIHNGEKLYARRDCCSTDQNFSQHLCIQTLAGFLLLVSSSWSASSLAITFLIFSITVVLPRPLGIWICKPNRSLLCWYQGCNIAAIVGSQNEIPHWNASSSLHSQLLFRFQNYISMKVETLETFSDWTVWHF